MDKIEELENMQKELKSMYIYYINKSDYTSLYNVASQMYRNDFTIKTLKELEE